ncbi:MAG: DUF808 domain-containing protein [Reinekea sp.]|jgi:uncharacterized protein
MAGTSLLALIDDIATLLDDIAVQSKLTAQKTVGVLGDDLALNAEQVAGVRAERELPVIWAVTKGSLVNKAILVPLAILISLFIPWAITPLLMIGGSYLCFEGAEKLAHRFLHSASEDQQAIEQEKQALVNEKKDMVTFEKNKIRGAIRTDFILSAEIIVISLGVLTDQSLPMKAIVLALIAFVLTLGVYGLVAALVKIDDLGLHLLNKGQAKGWRKTIGLGLLSAAPKIMKFLSIAGTVAMFIVGGGILVHGITPLHHLFEHWVDVIEHSRSTIAWLSHFIPLITNTVSGIIAGSLLVALMSVVERFKS